MSTKPHPIDESQQATWQELDASYIQETLDIYKPEHLDLEAVKWNQMSVEGRFRLVHNPYMAPAFREQHGDYIAAATLMVYLSQLGYVYLRLLAEADLLPGDVRVSTEEFFALRNSGKILVAGLDGVRFHRKVFMTEAFTTLTMTLVKSVRTDKAILGRVSFVLGDNDSAGSTTIAMQNI